VRCLREFLLITIPRFGKPLTPLLFALSPVRFTDWRLYFQRDPTDESLGSRRNRLVVDTDQPTRAAGGISVAHGVSRGSQIFAGFHFHRASLPTAYAVGYRYTVGCADWRCIRSVVVVQLCELEQSRSGRVIDNRPPIHRWDQAEHSSLASVNSVARFTGSSLDYDSIP
jgi:hypothetical protein